MIRITAKYSRGSKIAHHYKIAGKRIVFQSEVAELTKFHVEPATKKYSEILSRFANTSEFNLANATLVYEGEAPLGGEICKVACWRQGRFFQIDLDGKPACYGNTAEAHIHLLRKGQFSDATNLELVTGPALILLLAVNDIYCLHASAVKTKAGNVAFIGESGVGKSTLAKHAGQGWEQISDDILPVQTENKHDLQAVTLDVLTDFPQLKRKQACVYRGKENTCNLDWVIHITREPSDKLRFRKLNRIPAMLLVVRHTVAARLFNAAEIQQHAEFAKAVSAALPVYEIKYPRNKRELDRLRLKIVKSLLILKAGE